VRKRSTDGSSGVEARILSTLLNEIDGVGISSNVYETTNRLVLIIIINLGINTTLSMICLDEHII
jgi:SpoVK/Ycf46/Vps4 family AAA+-type ATPase